MERRDTPRTESKHTLRATIVTCFVCICTSIKFYYIGHWHCMAEEEEMKYTLHSISVAGSYLLCRTFFRIDELDHYLRVPRVTFLYYGDKTTVR